MKSVKIIVHGKVQGVFYRDSARNKALELGIRGYVKNLDEGSVEVVAVGDNESVRALIEWCYEGSDYAKVDSVEVEEFDSVEKFGGFEVRY